MTWKHFSWKIIQKYHVEPIPKPFSKKSILCIISFHQGFPTQTLTIHRTAAEGRNHALFLSTASTRSRTFSYLFATLHVRWPPRIFNRTACNYEATTRWVLPPYWITILIDWWCNVGFSLLLDDLILNFCYNSLSLETGGLELTSTITLVLQATRPTKCACISLDQQSKVLCNLFLLYAKLRAIEKYWNLYLIQNFFKKTE